MSDPSVNFDFAELEQARQDRNQSVTEACGEIGCSVAAWYNWAKDVIPMNALRKNISAYIAASKK